MLAACELHKANIVHGQLLQDDHVQYRHFVIASDKTVRVVDFSSAAKHWWGPCHAAVHPHLIGGGNPWVSSCWELSDLDMEFYKLEHPRYNASTI